VSAQPTGALPPSMSRSAAVSGVLFALLHGAALVLVRLSVPGATTERRDWLARDASTLAPTLHLLAYAGIAFLWTATAAKGPLDRGLHRVYNAAAHGRRVAPTAKVIRRQMGRMGRMGRRCGPCGPKC
jgi:hypothetical protein